MFVLYCIDHFDLNIERVCEVEACKHTIAPCPRMSNVIENITKHNKEKYIATTKASTDDVYLSPTNNFFRVFEREDQTNGFKKYVPSIVGTYGIDEDESGYYFVTDE